MARTAEQSVKSQDKYLEKKYNVAPKIAAAQPKIDHNRVKKALRSLYDFICIYGPGAICQYAPPPEMRPLLDDMERCASKVGGYQIQMSRGYGKTTFVGGLALYRLVKGLSHFVEIVAATDGKATDIFDTIVSMFSSELFGNDFPSVSVPIVMSGGNSIRMARLHYNGKPLDMEHKAGRFILPNIEGEPMSQAKIVIKSFTAKDLRGLNVYSERPDFIILDDIQTDDMAASPEQIRKAVKTINQVIRGQFAHNKQGTMLMTATPIFPGDVSELIKEDPGWITKVYPMMTSMPENRDLWDKYGEVLHAEIAAASVGEKPKETALAFYRKNRRELDKGAKPLSPHVYIRGRELSAVQHAMNIIYGSTNGEEVFDTEYQMKPRRSQSVYDISYKTILRAANGVPQFVVPNGCVRVFATIDVMKNAGLRYVVMAFGESRMASIINYGRYPANEQPIFNNSDLEPVKDSKLAAALDELTDALRNNVFISADGKRRYRIGAIGIDAGWMYRTVISFCERHQEFFAMRGFYYDSFTPRRRNGALADGVIDATDWVYHRRVDRGYYLGFHSDYWRETAQRAWMSEPLHPSSISVFGNASQHLQLAYECVAEQLIEKDRMRSGQEVWKWSQPKGANHLGDCVTMCLALAHWRRSYSVGSDIGEDAVSHFPTPPKAHKTRHSVTIL